MAKNKAKLKPCKCGGTPEVAEVEIPSVWTRGRTSFTVYKVVCKECGQDTMVSGSKDTVIRYWNEKE